MLIEFLLMGTTFCLNVYPSQYESYFWDLQALFNYVEDPTYTLIDDSINFQIKEPFQTNNQPRNHEQKANSLISAKAKTTKEGNFWMFNFIFIDSDGKSVNLYNAKSEQDSIYTPYFNIIIPVVSNDDNITCYDTDFVTADLYIVDCSRYLGLGYVDQLIILNQNEIKTYEQSTTRTAPLNSRILKTCIILEDAYALRGEAQSPSYIQIYKLNYDNTPTYGVLIDSKLLQDMFNLGLQYQFQLVDFIVNFKNELYILDKSYLFLIQMQADGLISPRQVLTKFTKIPIAFDWNYYIDDMDNFIEVEIILFNDEFTISQTKSTLKQIAIPFQCGSDARIKISGEFIVITSNGMEYLYSVFHNNMIYKMKLENQIPLFNPQIPKFISISQTQTNLYYISNGMLYLNSPQNIVNQYVVSVQALSNGQTLERSMNYSIIEQNDQVLYQVRDVDFFKGPISDMNDFTYIQSCWSGPNMKYSSVKQEFQFYQSVPLNIEANSYAPDSLRYASILQIDDDKLYMIFQLKTLEINILNCTRGEQGLFDNCRQEFKITDYITFLFDQSFQWWSFQDQDLVNDKVNLAWIEQDNNVTIIQQTGIIYTNQIDLPHQCSVKQILYLQNFLVVLCPTQIFLYDETLQYQLIQIIDEVLMQKLGYKDQWNPSQIFGNWKAQGNYLIIQNNNQLLITKYIFTLALLHRINLPEVGAQIKIALNNETFFLVSQGQKEYILEYSLNEQIGLLKQVPLFHYSLQKPLDITYSLDSGLLFASAHFNYDRFYTLVYQPRVLAHDSLLQTIELQDPGQIQAAGGDQQNTYYYYNNGQQQSEQVIFKNTIAQSQIQIKSDYYFNSYLAELIIMNDVSYHQVYENIELINTMSTIYMDGSELKELEIDQMNNYDQVNLNSNWYMGQVTTFSLDCKICGNNVKLLNPINKINSMSFLNYTINFISYFDERYNLFLDQSQLLLVNLDNNVDNKLILDQQYICLQAKSTPNKQYILTFCKVNYVLYAILIKQQDYELKQFKNAQYLKDITVLTKFQFLNNNLLILQSGVDVFVYNLVYDQNSWRLEQQQQLSEKAEDFDSIVTRLNMYIISILEYDILIILQCDQISEHLNIQFKTIIDIKQQLNQMKMYYTSKTHFQLCHFHDHLQNDNQHDIQLQILIIADNVAHYLFNFWLNQQQLIESNIISILNQYGDWTALKIAAYYNNYISLIYSKHGQRLLVIYHLITHNQQTITFLGGIKQTISNYQTEKIPLVIFMYPKQQVINNELSNQLTHLYSNFQEYDQRNDVISTYQIYHSPQLAFIGGLQIDHSTQVQITGLNDFSNYTISLTIQEVIDNTTRKTSPFWLIFLLSSLVILAFLLTIFVCRRRGILQGQSQDTIARQARNQQSDGEQQLLNNI